MVDALRFNIYLTTTCILQIKLKTGLMEKVIGGQVSDENWFDWKWQMRNRLTKKNDFLNIYS